MYEDDSSLSRFALQMIKGVHVIDNIFIVPSALCLGQISEDRKCRQCVAALSFVSTSFVVSFRRKMFLCRPEN